MTCFVYILQSQKDGRYYIGQTTNILRRLIEHNRGNVRSTKSRAPWRVIHTEVFASRTEAIKREHLLKSPSGWLELSKMKSKGRGFPNGITS